MREEPLSLSYLFVNGKSGPKLHRNASKKGVAQSSKIGYDKG